MTETAMRLATERSEWSERMRGSDAMAMAMATAIVRQ